LCGEDTPLSDHHPLINIANSMKISYTTMYAAQDLHAWSGLGYFIARSLEKQDGELDYIGDLKGGKPLPLLLKKLYYRGLGKEFFFEREPSVLKGYARQISGRLRPDTDVIFSPGSVPIAFLHAGKPKVFYTDACFAGMIGFYDSFSNLCRETIAHGNYVEQVALETCDLAIYASDWAAQTAISNYNVDPSKVKVVPFGANIDAERDEDAITDMVRARPDRSCQLLFLGVDWERKGGKLAVAVAEELNKAGLPTTLHVVGIPKIPVDPLPGFVVNHGFISKADPEGRKKMERLLGSSHFLILPTRAECFGVVFCEASSFALPSLSTQVGGIPSAIRDDVNGKMFPLSGGADQYVQYILSVFQDPGRYRELAFSSFAEYRLRLNWGSSGAIIMKMLKEL
jgi:glycosyltransferase involved in cell wall biosynthesis